MVDPGRVGVDVSLHQAPARGQGRHRARGGIQPFQTLNVERMEVYSAHTLAIKSLFKNGHVHKSTTENGKKKASKQQCFSASPKGSSYEKAFFCVM